MAEKSEKASPKKLRDARKKGQVAKSKDFPAALTFIVSISTAILGAGYIYNQLTHFMMTAFNAVGANPDLEHRAGGFIHAAIETILRASLPIMIFTTVVGVMVNFLVIGPVFSFEAMKPDIKKLNPVTNLKNMFKIKTFVELIKSVLKIFIAMYLIYTVVYDSLPMLVATAGTPVVGSAVLFGDFLMRVAVRVGVFFLIIAVADLAFQKKTFAKEMMMEKFELKQEMKDTEGNPEIKQKRKQVAQEMAYQDGPPSVSRAKAMITNPTHIAVAIEYDAEEDPAPKIVTMGKGIVAESMMEYALMYDVPIMRNVELAQELYELGTISHFVPEETYEAIAEVLKWLSQLEEQKRIQDEIGLDLFS